MENHHLDLPFPWKYIRSWIQKVSSPLFNNVHLLPHPDDPLLVALPGHLQPSRHEPAYIRQHRQHERDTNDTKHKTKQPPTKSLSSKVSITCPEETLSKSECKDLPTNSSENGEWEEAGLDIVPVTGELLGHNIHPCRGGWGTGGLIGRQGGVYQL